MQSGKHVRAGKTNAFTERIPDNVLLEPVDYLFADHCRQADMCEALRCFVDHYFDAPSDPALAADILSCLDNELNLHIEDEEQDLFPRLRACSKPEDHFPELLRLIGREHDRDQSLASEVRAGLSDVVHNRPLADPDRFCRAATALAASHVSHLEWENAVVLPLARKRLSAQDLEDMGRAMAFRRSITYPKP